MEAKGVYAAGGLVGAVLASTCCVAPFVFLLLGISGAWMSHLPALAPFQPIFLLTSLGFLAVGFWKVYGKSHRSYEESPSCGTSRSDRTVKVVLWMATLIIVTAINVERLGTLFL